MGRANASKMLPALTTLALLLRGLPLEG
uniref:Uncharacterized protein n=1 Tax=Arundo donax TaxID=35708 RepID=A0A0A8ZS61_ARUDO